jgi:PAS domain S-box-containing protein
MQDDAPAGGLTTSRAPRVAADVGFGSGELLHIFQASPIPMALVSLEGPVLRLNDRFTETLGYHLDDIPTLQAWWEKAYPDETYRAWVIETWQLSVKTSAEAGRDAAPVEYRITCKNGDERTMEVAGVALGNVLLAVFVDVTERRRVEDELAESAARFRALADSGQALVWTSGLDGKCDYFNRPWLDFTGRALEQELGDGWVEGVHPDDVSRCYTTYTEAFAKRASFSMDYRLRRRDGEYRWIQHDGTPRFGARGEFVGYVGHCLDITVRKEAEDKVRASEKRLQASEERLAFAVRATGAGVWDWDVRHDRMTWDDRMYELYGVDRMTAPSTVAVWESGLHPEDRARAISESADALAGRRPYDTEFRVKRPDGNVVFIKADGLVLRDPDGTPQRMIGLNRDVTAQKSAELALRKSERVLLQSQEIAHIGSYVVDVTTGRLTSSVTLDAIFGLDASAPRKTEEWLEIIHPEDRYSVSLHLADVLVRGPRFDREYRVVNRKSGETLWVHGLGELERGPGGEPLRLVGTVQDITTRKMADSERAALQAKLSMAQRLAAMGTLVSGIAHEINNPLTANQAGEGVALEEAHGLLGLFDGPTPLDREAVRHRMAVIVEALEDASEGGQRVARIVKDLAAFANPDPKRTRLRVSDLVVAAVRWMPKALAQGVDIRVEDGDAPPVLASAGQIEQVLVNLVTNAAKATPPGRRGDIVIRTGPGGPGMARIEVEDRGAGIAPEIRDRIFEPFFTTRRVGVGRGAGLGLAICHAIVTDHGGTITVESEVGKGSTFRVELPAAPAEA